MDIYKARYKNALRIAARINHFLKRGYLVFNEDGQRETNLFELEGNRIIQIDKSTKGHTFTILHFENHKNWDHGLYDKISDFNARFKNWTIVHPKNVEKLI